jgi:hypothetical protein
MQNAVYGICKDDQIIFDDPDINVNNYRVLVAFFEEVPIVT